jgi:hypothetical protein
MGSDPSREPPFFFSKPSDAVVAVARTSGAGGAALLTLPFPSATANLHYEVEQARENARACAVTSACARGRTQAGGACAQVVALCRGGCDISEADAPGCVFGYGVGIDFTRRDMQARSVPSACRACPPFPPPRSRAPVRTPRRTRPSARGGRGTCPRRGVQRCCGAVPALRAWVHA